MALSFVKEYVLFQVIIEILENDGNSFSFHPLASPSDGSEEKGIQLLPISSMANISTVYLISIRITQSWFVIMDLYYCHCGFRNIESIKCLNTKFRKEFFTELSVSNLKILLMLLLNKKYIYFNGIKLINTMTYFDLKSFPNIFYL